MARLKRCISLKPIPPFVLGVARFFQETQCRDRLSKELAHQYLAMQDVKPLHTFFVSKKQLILKVGID